MTKKTTAIPLENGMAVVLGMLPIPQKYLLTPYLHTYALNSLRKQSGKP